MSSKRFGKGNPKDLRMLWDVYNLPGFCATNTFIIDDHPDVKESQKHLCVHCPEFETLEGGELDNYLQNLKTGMEKYLKEFKRRKGKVSNPSSIITPPR